MAKEIKKIEKAAKELGYVLHKVAKNGHLMYSHPETGALVTVAGTPSDSHSFRNALGRLRSGAKQAPQD